MFRIKINIQNLKKPRIDILQVTTTNWNDFFRNVIKNVKKNINLKYKKTFRNNIKLF